MDEQTLQAIYNLIERYIDECGYAPTVREISARCYMSRSTVMRYLDRLEGQGRLSREVGKARSIVLHDKRDGGRQT